MGQRFLTIHPTTLTGTTQEKAIRRRVIDFGVTITQRIRDIPNDRFGELAYLEELSMSLVLEQVLTVIESEFTTQRFKDSLSEIVGPIQYTIASGFRFRSINLDPKHMYPSDFATRNNKDDKAQLYDKISGYSMTAVFESPEYQAKLSPFQCHNIEDTPT
jgi:hypothetical protein